MNQEKEIKQFNRLYLQLAAEKTEMNRAKTIAENKLAKKKEKFEELQHQYTVVVKQYQQQNKINQSLGTSIQKLIQLASTKDGFESLQNTSSLIELLGLSPSNNSEMEFDSTSIMSHSVREKKTTPELIH